MRGRFRTTKRFLFYVAVRCLQTICRLLPRRAAMRALGLVADAAFLVDRPARRRSLAHLEIAFGAPDDPRGRLRLVREMFRSTARQVADLLRRPQGDGYPDLVDIDGREHLERALAQGRGVVALSGHLGNWEMLGAALAGRGFPIHVMAKPTFDRRSDRMLNDWRRANGVRVIRPEGGLRRAVRVLRGGGVLGVLVDQDAGGASVFVDFFGRPARTRRAPFQLARRLGAPLVPMVVTLGPDGRHRVEIGEPIAPSPPADAEAALKADVAAWHAFLERAIRRAPEQWVWHHRRWKTRPPGEARFRKFSREVPYLESYQPSSKAAVAR